MEELEKQEVTPQEQPSELIDAAEPQEQMIEQEEPHYKKQFTLTYRITQEDLYRFQMWFSRERIEKGQKRSRIMAMIELFFGCAYLISMVMTPGSDTMVQYLLAALLMGMGVYGLVLQKRGADWSVRKAIARQYQASKHYQNDISVDFYQNKIIQRMQQSKQEVFWKDVLSVYYAEWSVIMLLDAKYCVVIPTERMEEKQIAQLKEFVHAACETYGKSEETI